MVLTPPFPGGVHLANSSKQKMDLLGAAGIPFGSPPRRVCKAEDAKPPARGEHKDRQHPPHKWVHTPASEVCGGAVTTSQTSCCGSDTEKKIQGYDAKAN